MQGINFKAFDLGGHEIARRVWKDYYAKARRVPLCTTPSWLQWLAACVCAPACSNSGLSSMPEGVHLQRGRREQKR